MQGVGISTGLIPLLWLLLVCFLYYNWTVSCDSMILLPAGEDVQPWKDSVIKYLINPLWWCSQEGISDLANASSASESGIRGSGGALVAWLTMDCRWSGREVSYRVSECDYQHQQWVVERILLGSSSCKPNWSPKWIMVCELSVSCAPLLEVCRHNNAIS